MQNRTTPKKIKIRSKVIFNSGNYKGLTGVIESTDFNSKNPNAIYGYYHTVLLSNGKIGHIEKMEHLKFL